MVIGDIRGNEKKKIKMRFPYVCMGFASGVTKGPPVSTPGDTQGWLDFQVVACRT